MNNNFKVYNSICNIKNLWIKLYFKNKSFSFFQTYLWNECLEQKFNTTFHLHKKLKYYVFRDKIIFPLIIDFKQKFICLLGDDDMSDYLNLIYTQEDIELLKQALYEFFNMYHGYKIIFSKIPSESLFSIILQKLKDDNRIFYEAKKTVCMCIDAKTDTDRFYASLSKGVRQAYRTACNRIKKQGWSYEIIISTNILDVQTANDLYSLYKQRRDDCDTRSYLYKKILTVIKKSLSVLGLLKRYDTLTMYSKKANVFLAKILIQGNLAAFYEGAFSEDGETLYVSRVATNKNYYHYSPGQILFIETIEKFKNKVRFFDLTRGEEEYKVKLGAKPHYNCLYQINI